MTTPRKRIHLLINRDFALLWSGQTISIIGDFVFQSALVLWITFRLAAGQSWEPLAVSGVFLATALPALLVRPLAGVFVDRWDKRRTMLRTDAIRAALVSLLILATGIIAIPGFSGGDLPVTVQLAAVYATVFLTAVCAQFFNPARLSLTGDIVPEALRGRAFGLDYTTENLAVVVGPPVAALFLVGIHWALLVNALSFAVSFLAVARIHALEAARSVASGERGNAGREFGAGVSFFVRSRALLTLTGVLCLISLGVGCLNALMPLYVQQTLGGTPQLYGFLVAMAGAGAICGSLLASALVPRLGNARAFWIGTLLLGADILALSQIHSVGPALAAAFLAGPPQALVNVATGPLLLHVTPRHLVGRVSSLLDPLVTASGLVSIALVGSLASTLLAGLQLQVVISGFALPFELGTITAIFVGASVVAFAGAGVALFALRGTDARESKAESAG